MGVNIKGGNSSSGLANVSTNYQLEVRTPQNQSQAGFVQMSSEVDSGAVTGTRLTLASDTSDDYRLRVAVDQTMFNMTFEGTNFPYGHMQIIATSMTAVQANGYMVLNSGSSATTGQGVYLRTLRHFPTFGTYPTYLDIWAKEVNYNVANSISEWGYLYLASGQQTTQQPTSGNIDGMFFRRNSAGDLKAVVNYNATEIETSIVTTNVPARDGTGVYDPTETSHYLISYHNDFVNFWINDTLVARVLCPAAQQGFTASSNIPMGARVFTIGTAASARQLQIGYINVGTGDQNTTKLWSHALSGSGAGAYQSQQGNAAAQTANYANSTAPTSAVVSNTVAGYTTLGGQWQIAANATNETDWALFGFTVPAGTPTLPGKTLYVTGIRIGETVVTGAAGVNATSFFWAAACGSNNVSLATTDGGAGVTTTHAPRRVALGSQSFLATAAIGTQAPGFAVDFASAPLVCPAGTFFHVILKQLNGAATASLIWRGTVTVMGYWE